MKRSNPSSAPSRGRGRPRKEQLQARDVDVMDETASNTSTEEPLDVPSRGPRRGRGRPRNQKSKEDSSDEEPDEEEETAPRRGRGRPRNQASRTHPTVDDAYQKSSSEEDTRADETDEEEETAIDQINKSLASLRKFRNKLAEADNCEYIKRITSFIPSFVFLGELRGLEFTNK